MEYLFPSLTGWTQITKTLWQHSFAQMAGILVDILFVIILFIYLIYLFIILFIYYLFQSNVVMDYTLMTDS